VEIENGSNQETPTPNNNYVSNIKQNGHGIEPMNQIPGYLSIYAIFQVFLWNVDLFIEICIS